MGSDLARHKYSYCNLLPEQKSLLILHKREHSSDSLKKKTSSSRYYSAPIYVEKQLAETVITKADVTPFLVLFYLYVYSMI